MRQQSRFVVHFLFIPNLKRKRVYTDEVNNIRETGQYTGDDK